MKNFLPEGFKGKASSAEKKILAEHKKLHGTSELEAKYGYVKLARSLSTFGVHFFLVRVSLINQIINAYTLLKRNPKKEEQKWYPYY